MYQFKCPITELVTDMTNKGLDSLTFFELYERHTDDVRFVIGLSNKDRTKSALINVQIDQETDVRDMVDAADPLDEFGFVITNRSFKLVGKLGNDKVTVRIPYTKVNWFKLSPIN